MWTTSVTVRNSAGSSRTVSGRTLRRYEAACQVSAIAIYVSAGIGASQTAPAEAYAGTLALAGMAIGAVAIAMAALDLPDATQAAKPIAWTAIGTLTAALGAEAGDTAVATWAAAAAPYEWTLVGTAMTGLAAYLTLAYHNPVSQRNVHRGRERNAPASS